MSLAIDPATITRVLLADGWYDVTQGTFDLDSYEYVTAEWTSDQGSTHGGHVLHGGGRSGVCPTAFTFHTARAGGMQISGPLTSVLAIAQREQKR